MINAANRNAVAIVRVLSRLTREFSGSEVERVVKVERVGSEKGALHIRAGCEWTGK